MNNAPVRILIADGDPLICRALARLLGSSKEVEVIATALDREGAIERIGRLRPAVALVDAHLALPNGIPATVDTNQAYGTQVIVLGVYNALRDEALRNGACRFVLKDSSRAELVAAIQLAARGECEH